VSLRNAGNISTSTLCRYSRKDPVEMTDHFESLESVLLIFLRFARPDIRDAGNNTYK
jgi:hypothetical protein